MLVLLLVTLVDTACVEVSRGYSGLHLHGGPIGDSWLRVAGRCEEWSWESEKWVVQRWAGCYLKSLSIIMWAWLDSTSMGWGVGIGSGRLTLLPADGEQDQGAGRRVKVTRRVQTLRSLEQGLCIHWAEVGQYLISQVPAYTRVGQRFQLPSTPLGRSSGGGNGNPLQYSSLENPMDRGPWGCEELDRT